MTWNNFANQLVITSRRRALTTAIVYGLSLAVRFTSATGEQVEIPAQSVQTTHPVISIMARVGAQLPYQNWGPKTAQPIAFRHGGPLSSDDLDTRCPASSARETVSSPMIAAVTVDQAK
jgi:hypothetical protein